MSKITKFNVKLQKLMINFTKTNFTPMQLLIALAETFFISLAKNKHSMEK